MSLYFKHTTDIYISKVSDSSANAGNTVLLNVKDFSFNQSSNVEIVGRNTLNPNQERTVDPYLSTISPVSFSFVTYILPIKPGATVTSPEEYLWTSLLGDDTIPGNSGATTSTIDFADGNVSSLHELTLWFYDSSKTEGNYRIDNAIIDTATINFDINGIAEIEWRGRALDIFEDNSPPTPTDLRNQSNYLKNKLSTLSVVSGSTFNVALIGGSIEIDNKNSFYGRNILGQTTVPTGHYTGNREITGTLQIYLRSGTDRSVDLFNQILTNANSNTYETSFLANITINIGGNTSPQYVQVNLPQVLFGIPEQNFDDVISLNLPFTAKEESGSYCSIIYNIP